MPRDRKWIENPWIQGEDVPVTHNCRSKRNAAMAPWMVDS